LAGVPLLRREGLSFRPRPPAEIHYLVERAYRDRHAAFEVAGQLQLVAHALNCEKIAAATALAENLPLTKLDWDGAVRIAYADAALRKAYNPEEPRDWHGQWTSSVGSLGLSITQPSPSMSPRRVQLASNDTTRASGASGAVPVSAAEAIESLPSDWVKLPPGDRNDEVADLIEWIANAKPEEELEIRREIQREFFDAGDLHGGRMLNMWLSQAAKPDRTTDERQYILDCLEHYSYRDPVEAGEFDRLMLDLALRGLPKALRSVGRAADGAEALAEDAPSPVWNFGWAKRGGIIEDAHGRTLVRNFPTIDAIPDGIAVSIKSIDLNAATYQSAGRLMRRLDEYIDKLANFSGASLGEDKVMAHEIAGRELRLIVPKRSASAEQLKVLEWERLRVKKLGIDLNIIPF
jgi:hypothetical protein